MPSSMRRCSPMCRPPVFEPGPAGTHITIRGLTKYFAGWPLYENFDLDIPKHKIVSVFGPNGCGKSTLINMIAGLVPIDSGEILFDGKSLQGHQDRLRVPELPRGDVPVDAHHRQHRLPAQARRPVQGRGGPAHGRAGRVFRRQVRPATATPTSCRAASSRPPPSCGRWRNNPEVLFLDEPFSALDFEMTLFIREKLQEVFMQTGTTMLLVSHDLEEAVYLADQVLLLTKRPDQGGRDPALRRRRGRARWRRCPSPASSAPRSCSLEIFQREVRR